MKGSILLFIIPSCSVTIQIISLMTLRTFSNCHQWLPKYQVQKFICTFIFLSLISHFLSIDYLLFETVSFISFNDSFSIIFYSLVTIGTFPKIVSNYDNIVFKWWLWNNSLLFLVVMDWKNNKTVCCIFLKFQIFFFALKVF